VGAYSKQLSRLLFGEPEGFAIVPRAKADRQVVVAIMGTDNGRGLLHGPGRTGGDVEGQKEA
jgi:hypothetical protein